MQSPIRNNKGYFLNASQYLCTMVAASARVMLTSGTSVVVVRPYTSPTAFAHFMASSAQEETLFTSVKHASVLVFATSIS